MTIQSLLYSADGPDQTPDLASTSVGSLTSSQLLWIDLVAPTGAELDQVSTLLDCPLDVLQLVETAKSRPSLVNYGTRFRLIASAVTLPRSGAPLEVEPLGLIAGTNYVVTVHGSGMEFLNELRQREQGESTIGALSAESFVASLLDRLLDTYFHALEVLVRDIDRIEVAILGKRLPSQFLDVLVTARKRVADLRRLLKSHRDVFHGLARPDFMATERPDTRPHFDALNKHYERAQDDLETARDLVIGSFELLSTRAAQKTNETMRALTFVTVLMGVLALLSGLLGMNFQLKFYESGLTGFLMVVTGMVLLAATAIWVAIKRAWI